MRLFARNDKGNVAILFAVALIPLIGVVGMAIDYSRTNAAKTRLQNALDSTALAMAFEPADLSDADLQARAMQIFTANFPDHARYMTAPLSVTRNDGTIVVSTSGGVPTTLTSLLHVDQLPINATSQATWGSGRIELALVLDNTGSMKGGKIAELRNAANLLLDTLESSARRPDDVKVSIVPFNTQVRLETGYEGADWLIMPDAAAERGGSGRGRGAERGRGRGQGGQAGAFDWTGCVMDRAQPYDVDDTAPAAQNIEQTGYPATDCDNGGLATLLPLTNDFGTLRSKVADLTADGMTNITIGVAWGMASLSSHAPLTESDPPNEPDLRRIMVVLTDGDNTENRWSGRRNEIDARTRLACESAKEAGILVYTVRVIDGNAGLLRDCATDPQHFYNVENVADLTPAFEGIAKSISRLRLAR